MEVQKSITTLLISAMGMALGYGIMAHADKWIPRVFADGGDMISTRALELVDNQGKREALIGTSGEGSPALWFYDKQGRVRLGIGLYGDGNASIVLNDENEQAVQIFRTVGPKSAPVLVMKSQGRDRIIMGLHSTQQDPFLVLYDDKGAKQNVFGTY